MQIVRTNASGIILAVLISVLFSASISYAQSSTQISSMTVFDANGTRVGDVLSTEVNIKGVVVPFTINERTFVLRVFRDGFAGNYTRLIFESDDCSGQPFLEFYKYSRVFSSRILPLVAVAGPGSTVYIEEPTSVPQTITGNSFLYDDGQNPPVCNTFEEPQTRDVLPAIPLINLDERFTPPFSVRLRTNKLAISP